MAEEPTLRLFSFQKKPVTVQLNDVESGSSGNKASGRQLEADPIHIDQLRAACVPYASLTPLTGNGHANHVSLGLLTSLKGKGQAKGSDASRLVSFRGSQLSPRPPALAILDGKARSRTKGRTRLSKARRKRTRAARARRHTAKKSE